MSILEKNYLHLGPIIYEPEKDYFYVISGPYIRDFPIFIRTQIFLQKTSISY
jgi:hypothetical protein